MSKLNKAIRLLALNIAICLAVLLPSCNIGGKSLYILFDRVDGLEEGSAVQAKGISIGKVKTLSFYKDKVIVETKIDPKYDIPQGSTFKLTSESLLNARAGVEVSFTTFEKFYQDGDTVTALPYSLPDPLKEKLSGSNIDSSSAKSINKIIQGMHELIKVDTVKQ